MRQSSHGGERERGDQPLGTKAAKEMREAERERKKGERQTEREKWETGRALLKENSVNMHRKCSSWPQLRT